MNIISYAFLRETGQRVLAALSYDSFAFLREYKSQFHELSNGLSNLEFEEKEDNLGRDMKENHQAGVNWMVIVDDKQFLSCSADCSIKVWRMPCDDELPRFGRDFAQDMINQIDCLYTYKDKYPILKVQLLSPTKLLILKYVSTLQILHLSYTSSGFIDHFIPVTIYHTPYSNKVLTILPLSQLDTSCQFITLYEDGVIPIYKAKNISEGSGQIEQYFKIEFNYNTTDIKMIKETSDFEVQMAITLIDEDHRTSLAIINYNWQNEISKYYQIVIQIPLNSNQYAIDKLLILNMYSFLCLSRRVHEYISFSHEQNTVNYLDYTIYSTMIEGGTYEQLTDSIVMKMPQFYSKKTSDKFLHPYAILNCGQDRRLTLVKVCDKSKHRACKIKVFKQTSHVYVTNCAIQIGEGLVAVGSADGRISVHLLKIQ